MCDRTAEGRVLKCLTAVDDATTETLAVVPAPALGGRPRYPRRGHARRHALLAPDAADGQRTGVLRARHADLFPRPRRHAPAEQTRQADAERLPRVAQCEPPSRVPECTLVHEPGACPARQRGLRTRGQRRATKGGAGQIDTRRLCAALDGEDEDGERNIRTLRPSAT